MEIINDTHVDKHHQHEYNFARKLPGSGSSSQPTMVSNSVYLP